MKPRIIHAEALLAGDEAPIRNAALVLDEEGTVLDVGPAADVLPRHAGAPVEMARGARRRGVRVIAVTSVEMSRSGEPDPRVGARLLDEADLVIDLCTPSADALITLDGLDTPVGPGSTITAVAVVNSLKVRIAELLMERGALPPVITRASVVGEERSQALFEAAYREHARRVARAIDQQGGA